MTTLRLALAQINVTVGDLDGNAAKIAEHLRRAETLGVDLVVFPELALCGYPPEDLLLKPHFVQACATRLRKLAAVARAAAALVGVPNASPDGVGNSAALLAHGEVIASFNKTLLPNYGVFDEKRYFTPGQSPLFFDLAGARIAVTICEDVWTERAATEEYFRRNGVRLIVNLSASPYHVRKGHERIKIMRRYAGRVQAALAYCNLVGGQDELVFDGGSFALERERGIIAAAPHFVENLLVTDLELPAANSAPAPINLPRATAAAARPAAPGSQPRELTLEEEIYAALVLGARDYVNKNAFKRVVIGLSGGIDSALTAKIAVDALGADRVVGVSMPSRYSSKATQSDAALIARNLGVEFHIIGIEPIFQAYAADLAELLGDEPPGVEMENLQARIRGNILMTLSNKFGWLVLTTGNKSETAVGYCTLYGDMAGGFAVIKDVFKTMVYRLAAHVNRRDGREIIPATVIERPPTAELRHDQKDQDTLPPYDVLDRILEQYVEKDKSREEIVAPGLDPKIVLDVIRMVDRSEYKRRQAPPGIKITPKAFGRDRRMPITNLFINSCKHK